MAKIERPDGKYELTGQTLWQLLLSNPKLCEAELIPSLQVIHTQWHLAPTVAALEKSLLRTAPITAGFDLAKTMHWVEQLGADTFRARQEAQRQLVELGPTVVPILRHLNADELDAEQRHRLRQIVRELTSDDHDDSVDHLTSLLAGDAWTWLVLIRRDEEDVRRMAWQRLSRLLPQPLEFDPAGTPEKRAAQAAVIERTIQSAFANHSPVANS